MELHHQFVELLLAVALTGVGYTQMDSPYASHIIKACAVFLALALVLLVARYFRDDPTDEDQCTEDQLMRATPTAATITAIVVGVIVCGSIVYTNKPGIIQGARNAGSAFLDINPGLSWRNWRTDLAEGRKKRAEKYLAALQRAENEQGQGITIGDYLRDIRGRFGRADDVQDDPVQLLPVGPHGGVRQGNDGDEFVPLRPGERQDDEPLADPAQNPLAEAQGGEELQRSSSVPVQRGSSSVRAGGPLAEQPAQAEAPGLGLDAPVVEAGQSVRGVGTARELGLGAPEVAPGQSVFGAAREPGRDL